MTYDDDFDEEEMFQNRKEGGQGRFFILEDKKPSPKKVIEKPQDNSDDDEDTDEILDEMARFVEGNDMELVKDRSSLVEDDQKAKKVK